MDYGHPLQLGAALPGDARAAVEIALVAEENGLDLVTAVDRSDDAQAEPWTVLGWVAGSTERVDLLAQLTDRPPAVLARAAASLDLLSGGRVGLAFAPAPADRVHGPADHADLLVALEESVEVVRGVWDAAAPGAFTYRGEHHVLSGAQRGPAPSRTIPVWLRGSGRLFDVVGRLADGWFAEDIAEARAGNPAIDVAATAARRDPREIRRAVTLDAAALDRLLTLPAEKAVAELFALVVDDGVATIVVDASREAVTEFATELAPRLRAAVAAERQRRGTVVGLVRSSAVRAARRPSIDYDAVPASLREEAVEPGDAPYSTVRSTYLRGGRPGLVLRPGSAPEVAQALAFARRQDVPLGVRSGGHGISGRSTNDGGIVIDLSRMNAIEVIDVGRRLVRVEPGARWGEVATALAPHGWAISSGDFGGVGVGGLATTGGVGFLGRAHGLTIDHVRAVEMVLADGSHVRADETENPDLFWAARGAGFNVGIATAFEMEAAEVAGVGYAQLIFDATDTAEVLQRWGEAVEAAPRALTSFLMMGAPRGGQIIAQTTTVIDSTDPDTILEMLQPMARVAPLVGQAVQVVPYPAVVAAPEARQYSEGQPVTRSGLLEHVTPEFAADAERLVRSGRTFFFQIRAMGGAMTDVPADATAFAHRSANFSVVAFGSSRHTLDAVWDGMHHHFDGLYPSFESDLSRERITEAFPPATLTRLRELKRRYDPDNVFRDNTNVEP